MTHDKKRQYVEALLTGGTFYAELYDSSGKLKLKTKAKNGVTNGGKDDVLDVYFGGGTQTDPWYIGLIDQSGFTALDPTDTSSSHAGWSESTAYTEANRVTWADDAAASQSKTNSTTADFTINASGTLKGVFLISENTKGGTTGILWATALFSADIVVGNGDILKITYTVNADDC